MRRLLMLVALLVTAVAVAACGGGDGNGSGSGAQAGTVVDGPGVSTGQPPWPLEQAHHAQRVRMVGAPLPGKETFHEHAILHVYADGLLVPLPAGVGFDKKRGILSGIHTHDATGVIHMEADKPFRTTLGDVFLEWGVRLSKNQLGGLQDGGDKRVYAYADGRPIADPAAYVIKKDDNLVIAYGKKGTFPLKPFTGPLKDANAGKSTCGTMNGKSVGSCTVGGKS